jgi:hypothetical protein
MRTAAGHAHCKVSGPDILEYHHTWVVLSHPGACLKIPSCGHLCPAGKTPSVLGRRSSHTCATSHLDPPPLSLPPLLRHSSQGRLHFSSCLPSSPKPVFVHLPSPPTLRCLNSCCLPCALFLLPLPLPSILAFPLHGSLCVFLLPHAPSCFPPALAGIPEAMYWST